MNEKDEALKMAIYSFEKIMEYTKDDLRAEILQCKKALEVYYKIEDSDFNEYSKQKLFEYIIFLRTALDNELQTKWIDVNELLPQLDSEVMTWGSGTANNSFGYMQAWYSKNGWQELDSCGDFFNDIPPTHWIPLSAYSYPK